MQILILADKKNISNKLNFYSAGCLQ